MSAVLYFACQGGSHNAFLQNSQTVMKDFDWLFLVILLNSENVVTMPHWLFALSDPDLIAVVYGNHARSCGTVYKDGITLVACERKIKQNWSCEILMWWIGNSLFNVEFYQLLILVWFFRHWCNHGRTYLIFLWRSLDFWLFSRFQAYKFINNNISDILDVFVDIESWMGTVIDIYRSLYQWSRKSNPHKR